LLVVQEGVKQNERAKKKYILAERRMRSAFIDKHAERRVPAQRAHPVERSVRASAAATVRRPRISSLHY